MTDVPLRNRRYLALWFPFLPAERWRIAQVHPCDAPADRPLVLIERSGNAQRLAAVDRAARTLGLTPGLTLADARACVPDVLTADHDPAADLHWLDRLADGCGRYTPVVAIDPPDGLILDITGCAHLTGGETALASDISRRLARLGMSVAQAIASTAAAAHALARHPAPNLDEAAAVRRLPVAALELDEDCSAALRRAGLKTVGDILCRPLAGIAARFGAGAVSAIRRLTGDEDAALNPRRIRPMVMAERRFAEPVASTEFALATLEALAGEAGERLELESAGGRRFDATFFRSDGLTFGLSVETSLPTRDRHAVMRLFRERVDTLTDPIDPGYGFDLIRLAVPIIDPLVPAQIELEGEVVGVADVTGLIDRLSTRLGKARVTRLVARNSHLPEAAQRALAVVETPRPSCWPAPPADEPPLRPIRLFDPPQRIEVIAEVPDGPPLRFRWQQGFYHIALSEGPERIAAEWWLKNPGSGLTRDYYRIEDVSGRRFWIFRHGLFGLERANPDWYLHGLFA